MATSLYKGQIPLRLTDQTICIHHKGSQLDLYCEDCHELACIKCLSTVHKSHTVCGLSEITPQNKHDIQNFIEKTEKVDIVNINEYITSTDIHLKDNHSNFENISHQLKTQTNKLKQDLDLLSAETLSLYKQMEDDNAQLLQTYKQDLEMYNTQLKQKVQDCETALKRGSNIQIYDAVCGIYSSVNLPVKPSLYTASFKPNQNPQTLLEHALGEVDTSGQGQGQASLGHDWSVGSVAGQGQPSTHQRSEPKVTTPSTQQRSEPKVMTPSTQQWLDPKVTTPSTQQRSDPKVKTPSTQQRSDPKVTTPSTQQRSERSDSNVTTPSTQQRSDPNVTTPSTQQQSKGRKEVSTPVYSLLPQTKVLGKWDAPCRITSVCPTADGQVWTCCDGSNTLTLLDRKGEVKQKVKHRTNITDISLSPTTNTLWACDRDNNITELMSGRLVHRFSTREYPRCICITASNHVIVGMAKHISKFTTEGELVLTTSAAGKPLVCSPHRISEFPVTQNVAVADWDDEDDDDYGGKGKPRVLVMDSDFKELFVYDGEIPNTYQPTSQSGDESFNPCGVVNDSVGNLIIGDRGKNSVLLISTSGRGEFRLIHTDDYWAGAVGVDREDVLWAVFDYDNVKLLQYTSK